MNCEHHGACLCGRVRFSFRGQPRFVADCVCESCRRAHGAAVVTWVGVTTEQFTVDAGEDNLRWYSSSEDSQRGFCGDCGTRLFFRSARWPGEMHIAVACVAAPHGLVSQLVSFAEEMPDWTRMTIGDRDPGADSQSGD